MGPRTSTPNGRASWTGATPRWTAIRASADRRTRSSAGSAPGSPSDRRPSGRAPRASRGRVSPGSRGGTGARGRVLQERTEGLGEGFLAAAEEAVQRVVEWPSAGTPLEAGRRRVYLRRFPYAVVYRILTNGRIRVLAVAD